MLSDDPFETAPVDWEPVVEPEPEAPKKAPAKKAAPKAATPETSDSKIVLTFKEGAGFDASWTVVHADTVADGLAVLKDPEFKDLLDQAKKVAGYFRGGETAAATAAPRAASPGSAPPAEAGDPPGPGWTYKSGVGKNGKVWKAWMPPRGSDEQPVWLR